MKGEGGMFRIATICWKLLLCSLVLIIVGITILFVLFRIDVDDSGTYAFTTLKTKNDYVLDIRAEKFWELAQAIYCTVMKNGETIFPLKMIGARGDFSGKIEFALIETEDELVAVVEKSAPHVILAIYDLKNLKSWRENRAVRQELLQRLKKDNPETPFILSSDIKGDGKLKVQ